MPYHAALNYKFTEVIQIMKIGHKNAEQICDTGVVDSTHSFF